MTDLLSLSGVYRIEEDPKIPGSEEMTWPYDYRVKVTRDESDDNVYNISNDVTSGGEYMESFVQIRDNKDGTFDLSYDEYGDGNYQHADGIEEDILMAHLNHLVNMDVAVKVSELPTERTENEKTREDLEANAKKTEDSLSTEKHYLSFIPSNDFDSEDMTKTLREYLSDAGVKWQDVKEKDGNYFITIIGNDKELNEAMILIEGCGFFKQWLKESLYEDFKESELHEPLRESIEDSAIDRFKAVETDKMTTEEVNINDVIEDFLNYQDAADQMTFREGIALVNELLLKQETLTESKKNKPARKRKRA